MSLITLNGHSLSIEHQWGSHPKPMDPGAEIQDPHSLRCAPQILGAFQEALWHVEQVVTRELNASTDNPLIFPDAGMVIHCGDFARLHKLVRGISPRLEGDRPLAGDIARVTDLLQSEEAQQACLSPRGAADAD